MTESRNIFDLLAKIEWEGGVYAVLEYGLHNIDDYDVPDELKEAWDDMVSLFGEFEGLVEDVYALLSRFENQYNESKEF